MPYSELTRDQLEAQLRQTREQLEHEISEQNACYARLRRTEAALRHALRLISFLTKAHVDG